jgi:Big-like domain-containing protein
MPTVEIQYPADGMTVTAGQPLTVTGQATDRGGTNPFMIDSVTVQVDGGPAVDATLKNLPDPHNTVVSFTAPVQVTGAEGVHTITAVATNDADVSRSVSVTVFLGPSFQIDAPAIRLEIAMPSAFSIDPADPKVQALAGRMQQGLVQMSALLVSVGKLIAGPNLVLAQDPSGRTVLRIGLWVEDLGFTVQPPSPPQFPLPRLSDAAAATGFTLAPLLPRPEPVSNVDMPFAVSVAATVPQDLVDAALATMHGDDKPDAVTVSMWPEGVWPYRLPNTVITEATGTSYEVPWTITVTEVLGTVAARPAIVWTSRSGNFGDWLDWLIGTLIPLIDIALLAGWQDVSRKADDQGGVAAPLVADLPTNIPFHNTDISGMPNGGPLPIDFPVLVADWAALWVTGDAIVGNGNAKIGSRDQSQAGLAIEGPDFVQVPLGEPIANVNYLIVLSNLTPDPGTFTWRLWSSIDDTTQTGTIDLGSFAQTAYLDIDFPMPLHLAPGKYRYELSVAATETCGTDPTKILTASAAKDITVLKPPPQPVKPGAQKRAMAEGERVRARETA